MIDNKGYRPNVGIIICNDKGQLLWTKRVGQDAWQFPQGGINEGETPEEALFRELHEEIGLEKEDVQILCKSSSWLKYKLPKRLIRSESFPVCIGQSQKWFLLRLTGSENKISFTKGEKQEFDDWKWVNFWYPLRLVVNFKKEVYRRALLEFCEFLHPSAKEVPKGRLNPFVVST